MLYDPVQWDILSFNDKHYHNSEYNHNMNNHYHNIKTEQNTVPWTCRRQHLTNGVVICDTYTMVTCDSYTVVMCHVEKIAFDVVPLYGPKLQDDDGDD